MESGFKLKRLWNHSAAGTALILGAGVAAALLLFFGYLTWKGIGLWRAGEKRDMSVLARRSAFAAGFDVYLRANALNDRGELEKAAQYYREALKIYPDFAAAYNNMGVALAKAGKLDEATASLREALRIKPEYAEGHYNLGLALSMRGKIDEAIPHYRRALSLRPEYPEAQRELNRALGRQQAH